MSDPKPTQIPNSADETRDFIGAEADACVALLQPALSAMADRWANDPPELVRVRRLGQIAAVRGLGDWMLDVLRDQGADRGDVMAVQRLTAAMADAFARQAALQAAVLASGDKVAS